jgi:predicted dehydrogenase
MLFDDTDKHAAEALRTSVVAQAQRSPAAVTKQTTGLTPDGLPVHSFRSLLADLSSYAPGNRLDDDASILMRLDKGAKAALVTSKVATGEENGVRLRVYGDKASLYWNQEENNYLSVKYPFAPEKIYKRNAPYMADASAASVRSSRIPAGHHEGFIEAFANIYDEFCAAVRDRKAHDFPGAREGVRTMKFVEAALRSNAGGNCWENV